MASMGSKGNPASKRMMNVKLKEKRARSWAAGERRKKANREANEDRNKANIVACKFAGLPFGHKNLRPSKVLRTQRRAAERV